jgi:hypothetical protein
MKLALIFLSALVAITHQQFQQQPSGSPWWSPYPAQLPRIVADRREIYYSLQDDIPSIRRYRPVRPVPYFSQVSEFILDCYRDQKPEFYKSELLFNI